MSALARFSSDLPMPLADLRQPMRRRRWRLLLRAGLTTLAAAGVAAAGLEAAAGLLAWRRPAGLPPDSAAAARWTDIVHPIALYDLAGTTFSRLPAAYRARRRDPDGAREDVMTFGRLADAKPYLQLSLLRADGEAEGSGDGLADGLARLAGTHGLTATRIRPTAPIDTRIGRIEAADLLLWDDGAAVPCLGFSGMAGGGTVLRLSGFACGAPDRPIGRATLACALDRVDLLSAGEDAALRAIFVAAERRGRAPCAPGGASGWARSLLAPSQRLGWLDTDGETPPLRGLFGDMVGQR